MAVSSQVETAQSSRRMNARQHANSMKALHKFTFRRFCTPECISTKGFHYVGIRRNSFPQPNSRTATWS